MKVYGLMVAQNEGDIIETTLNHLSNLNLFETIFFYDLGSHDDTFEKALKFKEFLYKPQKIDKIYTNKLRIDLLREHKSFYDYGDWLAIVDADELYAENPKNHLEFAEMEEATYVNCLHANFMFTDIDLNNFSPDKLNEPVYDRLKYYLIHWSEHRFYKYLPQDYNKIISYVKPCTKRILIKHYRYRSPEQIQTRINTRLENKQKAAKLPGRSFWIQVPSDNWEDYIVSQNLLHKYNNENFKFGLPEGTRWSDYFEKPHNSFVPQSSTAFKLEQQNINCKCAQHEKTEYEDFLIIRFGNGTVLFTSCYSKKVLDEVARDLISLKIREAFKGLKVLFKHSKVYLRHLNKILKDKIQLTYENKICNYIVTLKRIIALKGFGFLCVDNEINWVNDFYIFGKSNLKLGWKTHNIKKIEIRKGGPQGRLIAKGLGGEKKFIKIAVKDMDTFYLQDVSNRSGLSDEHTLAKITIRVMQGSTYKL